MEFEIFLLSVAALPQSTLTILKVLVAQLCPTLFDPMSLPGSSAHGILQARMLEWVVIPFSRESSWPRDQTLVSCIVGRFFTVWAIINYSRLYTGFIDGVNLSHP